MHDGNFCATTFDLDNSVLYVADDRSLENGLELMIWKVTFEVDGKLTCDWVSPLAIELCEVLGAVDIP